jgi:membrane protease YdiL (CAAX protease family)
LSFVPFGDGIVGYIVAAASTMIVFGLAIGLSIYFGSGKWFGRCFGAHKKGSFALSLSCSAVMMMQSAMIRSFLIGERYDYRAFSLYGMSFESAADSTGAFLLMFAVLAVLPSLAEGIFFRGFLMYEYRYGGVALSVIMSSFLYAMTGMSLWHFPVYFVNGVLLSVNVFLTGNLFYSILSHLLYGFFALSVEKYFFFTAQETPALSFLVMAAIGLLAVIWFFGSAEKILRQRGECEERMPVRLKKGRCFVVLADIFSAPMIWTDIGCFVLICALHILLDV